MEKNLSFNGFPIKYNNTNLIYSYIDLKSTLLHYWDLDTDNAVLLDKQGTNNLTKVGTVTTLLDAPDGGLCSNLGNGLGYFYKSNFAKPTAINNNFSYNIWAKSIATSSVGNWIISHRGDLQDKIYYQLLVRLVSTQQDVTSFYDTSSTNLRVDTPDESNLNQWYMYTYTKTPTELKLYRNGVLMASSVYANQIENNLTTSQPFAIGTGSWSLGSSTTIHRGQVFAAGIWASELTQAQITALYNNGNGRRYASL